MTLTATRTELLLADDAQELLFRSARSANTFSAEPVTDDQVAAIYELVKWAPTAMNTQPMRVVLVRTPEARARLVPHLAEGNRAKTASAPLVAILAADTEFHEHLPELLPYAPGAKDRFADAGSREQAHEQQHDQEHAQEPEDLARPPLKVELRQAGGLSLRRGRAFLGLGRHWRSVSKEAS